MSGIDYTHDYDDIINLPHFHAPGKAYMDNSARAAQFMPFKSLKPYDDVVEDTTDKINTEEKWYIEDEYIEW